MNNLFWEVSKNWQSGKKVKWAGNIFRNGKVDLSAFYLSTNYILLSVGGALGVEQLKKYGKAKKWKLSGITGPKEEALRFASTWEEESITSRISKRFTIFESGGLPNCSLPNEGLNLVKATEMEWPRIRLWAGEFANESNPPLDQLATISMAKLMLKQKNLYLLKNGDQSLGMAGFGRRTGKKVVINMVFIPPEFRRRKYGSVLVSLMIQEGKKQGFSSSLMFSDHLQGANLYHSLGCINRGEFDEIKFENLF